MNQHHTVDPDDPTAMALPVLGDVVRLADGHEATVLARPYYDVYDVRDDTGRLRKVHVSEIVGYPEHRPLAVESDQAPTPSVRTPLVRAGEAMQDAALEYLGRDLGTTYVHDIARHALTATLDVDEMEREIAGDLYGMAGQDVTALLHLRSDEHHRDRAERVAAWAVAVLRAHLLGGAA